MPKTYTALRVLMASPDDVAEERSLVEEVIDEYNRINNSLDLRLEPVGWEQDVIPELGADPQAIINDQIAGDYDIFIGILWTRFGTPTPRASSGTKEEFDLAYQRFLDAPDTLRIMIYFSECPTNPAELDPEQVRLVQEFRREVGNKGIYSTYKTRDEFKNLVRLHLSKQAQGWGKSWGTSEESPSRVTSSASRIASEPSRDDSSGVDEGLLDLIEQGSEAMAKSGQIITRINESVERLSQALTRRTAELKAASSSKDTRLVKRFVDRAADDLLTFSDQVDSEIPLFADMYGTALDAFGRSAVLLPEIGPSDAEAVRKSGDAVGALIESMESGKASMESLNQSVGSIPPMTTHMNRARTRAVSTLENLAAEWGRAIGASKDVGGLYELALQEISEWLSSNVEGSDKGGA